MEPENKKILAIREEPNTDMMLKDIENMQRMCTQLLKTKHYQALGETGLFAVVQKAKSLGINPLEAINGGLYFVQGKVGMSSEMMASLIRMAGHSIIKDPKSDNSVCILHGRRADNGDTWTISFSMEDAKRAGLAKNMYEKYPGVMLYNRAMSMLARQLFPDVIKGAGYCLDELKEIARSSSEQITYQEPQSSQDISLYVEEVEPIISTEQVTTLISDLEKCSKPFAKNVMDHINKTCGSIANMKVSFYENILEVVSNKLKETSNAA